MKIIKNIIEIDLRIIGHWTRNLYRLDATRYGAATEAG